MRFLALPRDESEIVVPIATELGLVLLHSDLTRAGKAIVTTDPSTVLPLPSPSWGRLRDAMTPGVGADPSYDEVWSLIFWAPEEGPIRTLGDAPPPDVSDDLANVALHLNQQATSEWRDLIDHERSPIIEFHRSAWHVSRNCLLGARFSTMPGYGRLHARVERRFRREAVRLDPYDCCPVPRPHRKRHDWMWALPNAAEWVAAGGRRTTSTTSTPA